MSVAIDINPEFSVQESAIGVGYNLDTGEEDLNRVIRTDSLESGNMNSIDVDGFNEYAHFDSLIDLEDFVKAYKEQGADFSLKEYKNSLVKGTGEPVHVDSKAIQDTVDNVKYTAVFGTVSVTLTNGTKVQLCQPVYRAYPNKQGEYLDISDVEQYINSTWTDLCKFAFFNKNNQGQPVAKKASSGEGLNVDKKVVGLGLAGVAVLALGAMVVPSLGQQQASSGTSSSLTSALTATSKPTTPMGGSNQSVEDYAKLQVQQTESMLKELGVDVSTQNANLGCFTTGG